MNIVSESGKPNVTVTLTRKELMAVAEGLEPAYNTLTEVMQLKGPCKNTNPDGSACRGCKRVEDDLRAMGDFLQLVHSTSTDKLMEQLLNLSGKKSFT